MTIQALTQGEFDELCSWVDANSQSWPEPMQALVQRLLHLYKSIAHDKKAAADVVKTLRQTMGFIPKSERGAQLLENK